MFCGQNDVTVKITDLTATVSPIGFRTRKIILVHVYFYQQCCVDITKDAAANSVHGKRKCFTQLF